MRPPPARKPKTAWTKAAVRRAPCSTRARDLMLLEHLAGRPSTFSSRRQVAWLLEKYPIAGRRIVEEIPRAYVC